MLRNDLKPWYGRAATAIRTEDVEELVDTIKARAPDIAGRVLRELRAAYRHALKRRRVPDGIDPTRGVDAPKESRYVPRDRAFTAGEWRAFVRWLAKSAMSDDVQDALMLVSLTACRPGEATSALWCDIDLKAGTWTIRKRKRDGAHVVFLSTAARALLRRRKATGQHVFPSPTKRDRPIREHALGELGRTDRHRWPPAERRCIHSERSTTLPARPPGERLKQEETCHANRRYLLSPGQTGAGRADGWYAAR